MLGHLVWVVVLSCAGYGLLLYPRVVREWLLGPGHYVPEGRDYPCMTVYFDDHCNIRNAVDGCCINKSGVDTIALLGVFLLLCVTSVAADLWRQRFHRNVKVD